MSWRFLSVSSPLPAHWLWSGSSDPSGIPLARKENSRNAWRFFSRNKFHLPCSPWRSVQSLHSNRPRTCHSYSLPGDVSQCAAFLLLEPRSAGLQALATCTWRRQSGRDDRVSWQCARSSVVELRGWLQRRVDSRDANLKQAVLRILHRQHPSGDQESWCMVAAAIRSPGDNRQPVRVFQPCAETPPRLARGASRHNGAQSVPSGHLQPGRDPAWHARRWRIQTTSRYLHLTIGLSSIHVTNSKLSVGYNIVVQLGLANSHVTWLSRTGQSYGYCIYKYIYCFLKRD